MKYIHHLLDYEMLNIQQQDVLIYCDLHGRDFRDIDLKKVTFFGCRLDGVSFSRANLSGAFFVGCSTLENDPVRFFESKLDGVKFADCSLSFDPRRDEQGASEWDSELIRLTQKTLSPSNLVRYEAAESLSILSDHLKVFPLGLRLSDPEWEIRLRSARALAEYLTQENRSHEHDEFVLIALVDLLGDASEVVRSFLREEFSRNVPKAEVLLAVTGRLRSPVIGARLHSLRAVSEMLSSQLMNRDNVDENLVLELGKDSDPNIRGTSMEVLGLLGDVSMNQGILIGLQDIEASVRLAALYALQELDDSSLLIEKAVFLLRDKDSEVRFHALNVLSCMGVLQEKHIAFALHDESSEVRRMARECAKHV